MTRTHVRRDVARLVIAFTLVGVAGAAAVFAQPVGTAFTYQGRLTDGGNPATGPYDLQLALFDAATGGAQVGATVTRDDVAVTNGLFTVPLDFGAVFTGSKRWLELRVRPGASTGAYTMLAGRQELMPSPNAAFASAVPWPGVANKPAGFADDTDNDALGGLPCANGQIAKRVSGSWSCADENAHDHLAQSWTGSSATGLSITNATGLALRGVSNGTASNASAIQGEISGSNGSGLFGLATATSGFASGVRGRSNARDGVGVTGEGTSTIGVAVGVLGVTSAPDGQGVFGIAGATSGGSNGVVGESDSTAGRGVFGFTTATSGATNGVRGTASSSAGFGGFFENTSGGPAVGVSAGGIRFSDGTTQTSAALGDITGVTAGTGLTGGAASGNATLGVNFGGSGSSNQVARRDHNHLSTTWSGPGGLAVSNTGSGIPGLWDFGLWGEALGPDDRAVIGYATATSGPAIGVWGQTSSTAGNAVLGYATATTGVNYGVLGQSDSPAGYAGFFRGNLGVANGKLLFGSTTRQMIDLQSPSYGIGAQGGVVYFRTELPAGMFTWFLGGSHSDTQNDPGPGGVRQMRLDGAGTLFVRGSVNPGGADFAEMLPGEQGLEPGDVLAIAPDGQLRLSTKPYEDTLAGVYSTKPGLVGGAADGENTDGKVPLAVAGVVPVKVTAENGPVKPGDLLTSSSTRGHAMRASRERVAVGVVIGKALEPLDSAAGVIRALVVLQ